MHKKLAIHSFPAHKIVIVTDGTAEHPGISSTGAPYIPTIGCQASNTGSSRNEDGSHPFSCSYWYWRHF